MSVFFKSIRYYLLSLLLCLSLFTAHAQAPRVDTVHARAPLQKFYIGNGLDGCIFSTAAIKKTDPVTGSATNSMGILRFSAFLNIGLTFNFNLTRHFGVYTGVDIKNVGFIEHTDGYTTKRRTYNVGAPLGIKIGNMAYRKGYLFLGGGGDVPFNYKEKQFQSRSQKTKTSEWFSGRTPAFMPYVFFGVTLNSGITFKAQYYPNNFMNADYSNNGIKPYAGYDVHLMMLSIGYHINYSKRTDIVKRTVEETKLM